MNKKEEQLQEACIELHELQFSDVLVFHIPNALKFMGNNRNAFFAELARRTKLGVKKGVPDLFLARAVDPYNGLFVEIKIDDEKPTKDQLEIHQWLYKEGYLVMVCKTLDEYLGLVRGYLGGSHDVFIESDRVGSSAL